MKSFYKGILFDLDGTLVDSWSFILKAFCASLAEHGFPPVSWEDLYNRCHGKSLAQAYQILTRQIDVEHFCRTHRFWQAHNAHWVKPFPYVRETLIEIHKMDIRMAVVTNRDDTAHESLKKTEIIEFFDTIRHVGNTKDGLSNPHPQMLFEASQALGIQLSRIVMVGDTPGDIQAAKNANAGKSVGVSYGFTEPVTMEKHNPDHIIHDIRELLRLIS